MINTKLAKTLKYWSMVMVIVTMVQGGAALFTISRGAETKPAPQPENKPVVLGAMTDMRGEPVTKTKPKAPVKRVEPVTETITAKSYLVYDDASKTVLLQKNASEKLSIASLTKLMTAWVVYKYGNLNDYITVSEKDIFNVSPVVGIKPGEEVKILDLFNAMLVGSANDAALALANYTAEKTGKSFVSLMNEEAKSLNMQNSRFSNPLGFDSVNNYSTANDLMLLTEATQKLSAFTSLSKRTDYSFTSRQGDQHRVTATNKLIKAYNDVEAIKTGYTETAQGSMMIAATNQGHKVIVIVIGSQNREADSITLKDAAFQAFSWQ